MICKISKINPPGGPFVTDVEPADDEVTAALELELVLAPDVTLGALAVVLIVKESALLARFSPTLPLRKLA